MKWSHLILLGIGVSVLIWASNNIAVYKNIVG